MTEFDGATFSRAADGDRLARQLKAVFDAMKDGTWRTPPEIEAASGANWASASARLRDLRKARFGAFTVDRQRKGDAARGLFQYRLRPPAPRQPDLFESTMGSEISTTAVMEG